MLWRHFCPWWEIDRTICDSASHCCSSPQLPSYLHTALRRVLVPQVQLTLQHTAAKQCLRQKHSADPTQHRSKGYLSLLQSRNPRRYYGLIPSGILSFVRWGKQSKSTFVSVCAPGYINTNCSTDNYWYCCFCVLCPGFPCKSHKSFPFLTQQELFYCTATINHTCPTQKLRGKKSESTWIQNRHFIRKNEQVKSPLVDYETIPPPASLLPLSIPS